MLSKRVIRESTRLAFGLIIIFLFVLVADFYMNFLPVVVQARLPHHIPSPVVLDLEVRSCYRASSCGLGADGWHQHTKNLYLGQNWFKKAYLYTKRVEETELTDAPVLLDLALPYENVKVVPERVLADIRHNNPAIDLDPLDTPRNTELAAGLGWSRKEHGIWVKRGRFRPGSAISQVKVLFGEHATYPVPGWKLLSGGLQGFMPRPRLAIRRGIEAKPRKSELKFNAEGNFKILQVADLHMSTGEGRCDHPVGLEEGQECLADLRTMEFVEEILDREHPDLVVFTGDQIVGDQAPDPETAMLKAVGPVIARDLPWALVFGNHDNQGPLDNAGLMELAQGLPGCLAEAGNVSGVGNYALKASMNGHRALTLYFIDSHGRLKGTKTHEYEWIHADQLQLMRDLRQEAKAEESKYAHIARSLAFFHMPIPEFRAGGERVGEHREGVTGPVRDEGVHTTLEEMDVSVAAVGHDHCNDYCLKSGKTWLCYGGSAGEGAYGGYDLGSGDMQRRLRVYEVRSQDSSIYSWKWVRGEEERLDYQRLR